MRAKLEPYLGFLHSIQEEKPSLVCDLIELYRYLIEDFLIQYCQDLKQKDFTFKTETLSRGKSSKREYLAEHKTRDLLGGFNDVFETCVEIPRIRAGKKQTVETLVNEEALLLAGYLRGERKTWNPRRASLALHKPSQCPQARGSRSAPDRHRNLQQVSLPLIL